MSESEIFHLTAEGRLAALQRENEDLRLRLSRLQLAEDKRAEIANHDREIANLRRALHRSEARYRLIVESAVDYAIIATDLDGTVTTWNEAAETTLGWSAEQMIGRPIKTIFTREDVANGIHEREMRLSLTEGKARDERWHLRANGSRFFASGEMMPLLDDDEQPAGFLKILRDRTQEVLERKELDASRERLRLALDASAIVGTFDWDVPADILFADQRFAAIFGIGEATARQGVSVAAFLDGIHPEDRARVGAKLEAAVASADIFAEEFRSAPAHGQIRWIFARGRCFHDATGRPQRFPGAIVDITSEKERNRRQAALLKLGDDMMRESGTTDYSRLALSILGETLGVSRVGYATIDRSGRYATVVNEWCEEGAAPLRGRYEIGLYGEHFLPALRKGLLVVEDVFKASETLDAAEDWARLSVRSLVNIAVVEGGEPKLIFYVHSSRLRRWSDEDIAFIREILARSWTYTRRRRAEIALKETETRLRLAQEAAEIGTFDYDLRTGVLIWDDRCRAMFGVSPGEAVSYDDVFLPALHPEDRARVEDAVAATIDPGSSGDYDITYRTIGIEDGALRHVHASGQTIVENGETVRFVGAVRDVTEEKLAEGRQQLLTRELQHRVKNTLAMVSAIANQTLRRATSIEDGLAAFSARVSALAKAHDILTETSWTAAPIADIVEQSLLTHRPAKGERMGWSGPKVMLTARQSLSLSLALHELATNAAKYGALSNDDGRVAIVWSVDTQAGTRCLRLQWREIGGPPVVVPTRKGFGSRLIQQSLSAEFGGNIVLDYQASGLVCSIDAPITFDEGEWPTG